MARKTAGEPGGLLGLRRPPFGSNVCFTVKVCRKSNGELMIEPNSLPSFIRERLNLPENVLDGYFKKFQLYGHKI